MLGFGAAGQFALGQAPTNPRWLTTAPGAGKHPSFPSYVPQPDYDAKPRKPFRPVWDRPPQRDIVVAEAPAQPATPPLPPATLFSQPLPNQPMPLNLPSFDNLVPPNPLDTRKWLQEAQDMSDIVALLRNMGVLNDE